MLPKMLNSIDVLDPIKMLAHRRAKILEYQGEIDSLKERMENDILSDVEKKGSNEPRRSSRNCNR